MRRRLVVAFSIALALVSACGGGTSERPLTTNAQVTLRTYAALVEQHLASVLLALDTLAATRDAASGQWSRIEPALTRVGDSLTTDAAVWFVRPDGSYYTAGNGLAAANLSDRTYFPRLMAGQQVRGDLVVSKSTGRMSCIVATPIRAGHAVVGGLGASIDMVEVAKMVDRTMALPPGTVFYALDPQGRTALHIDSAYIFDFPAQAGTPSLRSALRTMLGSPQGTVTYTFKGSKRSVVFMRSQPTGWVFALGTVRS